MANLLKNKNDAALPSFSTGIPSLDATLKNLAAGDNVVWQVDDIEDYRPLVERFVEYGLTTGAPLVYFRFASHRQLIPETPGVEIHNVEPEAGFEHFVGKILNVIENKGRGALYVFDGLSELAADWYSDRMLGNFFMITCPFLFKLDTIAYFALFRYHHSFHASESIHQTAQLVLDVYRNRDRFFIQPLKVDRRYSPTLYMLHEWTEDDNCLPVTSSTTISEILAGISQPWLDFSATRPGIWMKNLARAQKTIEAMKVGGAPVQDIQESFQRLLRSAITRDEKFMPLICRYFELPDLMAIIQRMIGTGLIGGKSLGMLLARAILRKKAPHLYEKLEPHDSFFIGADVYYTYLVQNGCWELKRKIGDSQVPTEHHEERQQRLLSGTFPDHIRRQFIEMLDYFGQSPIIVRSSSLLEDSYGNAFSGKYETVFCANQGTPEQRLEAFMAAVRHVYASTLSQEALAYRTQRGLLDQDEQMSLLIQRVSGALYGDNYFPQIAGVGFSFNPYVWNEDIDPEAGMLRLVFGLGTRAVDRISSDYTRLIALNAPEKQPEGGGSDAIRFSQREVDILDLPQNKLTAKEFNSVISGIPQEALSLDLFAEKTPATSSDFQHLTFRKLINDTTFVATMREILGKLQEAYAYPVDIEFTTNFMLNGDYRINLVQCRPFQVRMTGESSRMKAPSSVRKQDLLMESAGPVIGHSSSILVDRLIYVVPAVYGKMSESARYTVARTIGKLNRLKLAGTAPVVMMAGPGRWATSTPSLGIPVSFAEINSASVICEIAAMHEGLVPDVSLGTHFFNDLVELNMLYFAVSPDKKGHALNQEVLLTLPNRLTTLLPEAAAMESALRVVDGADLPGGLRLNLHADTVKQKVICYLGK
jgi:pyruvate,water dikinase